MISYIGTPRQLCVCIVCFCLLYICFWIYYSTNTLRYVPTAKLWNDEILKTGYLINTRGCLIPDFDPFNPEVIQFIERQDSLNCSEGKPLLVRSNFTSLYIDHSALSAYHIDHISDLSCCYTIFTAIPGPTWKLNIKTFSTDCKSFKDNVRIQDEFLFVTCDAYKKEIFKHYYAFVPNISKDWKSRYIINHTSTSLNVLIIGMDAVSRLNFHRQLPNTIRILRKLGMIELLGYNKVAEETFPNLAPLLSGLSRAEMEKTCWKHVDRTLDSCPWIWNNFHNAGFISGYAEDAIPLSMFVYHNEGFDEKQTDFDITPFMGAAEEDIGHKRTYTSKLCLGKQMCLDTLLDYVPKFASSFKNYRKFGFFWSTSLTHDNLNYASLADDPYVKLIRQLKVSKALENTILILLSDHGLRNDKIREVYQGYLEDRLPYVFFVFPQFFEELYPLAIDNLKNNTHRLTTAFDMYQTLLDLTNPDLLLNDKAIRIRSIQLQDTNSKPRGISLFLPISEFRTCKDAHIEPFFCTCHNSTTISLSGTLVQNIGIALVEFINSLLKNYKDCSLLSLVAVRSARIEYNPTQSYKEKKVQKHLQYYVITVETSPGGGLFEGMVAKSSKKNTYHIAGNVTRINMYGNQSTCIEEYYMKYFCYCLELINGKQ